jgi:hypothetical protein
MADVTHLRQCYRCRRIFPARRDERYCPACQRDVKRERNRRRLAVLSARTAAGDPVPLLLLLALTAAGSAAGAWAPPPVAPFAPAAGVMAGFYLAWRRVNR